MDFDTERIKTISRKIILVEYDIPLSLTNMLSYEAGIWFWTLTPGVVSVLSSDLTTGYYDDQNTTDYKLIKSLKVETEDYIEVDSIAELRAQEKSFLYDSETTYLYVHFDDFEPPLDKLIYLGIIRGFTNDVYNGAYYNDLYYEPRVNSIPSIKKKKDPLFFGIMQFVGGNIVFNNQDGYFDNFRQLNLYRQPIRILLGYEGLAYSEFEEIYTGYIDDFKREFDKFTIKAQDKRKALSRKIPSRVFNATEFPYIDEDNIDKPKPICYGSVRNVQPICTNEAYEDEFEEEPTYYYYFLADTYYHDITSVSAVYNDGTAVSQSYWSVDTSTGILSVHVEDAGVESPSDITVDFIGYNITNGLDVIKDLMLNYDSLQYMSNNYNTSEWVAARNQARTVGFYLDSEIELKNVIEMICDAVDGMFIVLGDGRYSFRIYSADRTISRRIYSYEWLDEPTISTNSSEFLSSCKVDYYKDYDNDKYRSYRNAEYEQEVLERYKAYNEKTFETILVNETAAQAKSEVIMSISKEIGDIITRKVGFQHIDLEVMDFITASPQTRQDEDEDLGTYEVIGITPDFNKFEIKLEMRFVEDTLETQNYYTQGLILGTYISGEKIASVTDVWSA